MGVSILDDAKHLADLDFYSTMWPKGNAMYWWAFTTGYAELGKMSKADAYFQKSTLDNVYGPFKIWSESQGGGGCPNFLSGAGGYLQSIWAGYAGIRFSDDSLHIFSPRIPPGGAKAMTIRQLHFAGAKINVRVTLNGTLIGLQVHGPAALMVVVDSRRAVPLTAAGTSLDTGKHARIFQSSSISSAVALV